MYSTQSTSHGRCGFHLGSTDFPLKTFERLVRQGFTDGTCFVWQDLRRMLALSWYLFPLIYSSRFSVVISLFLYFFSLFCLALLNLTLNSSLSILSFPSWSSIAKAILNPDWGLIRIVNKNKYSLKKIKIYFFFEVD